MFCGMLLPTNEDMLAGYVCSGDFELSIYFYLNYFPYMLLAAAMLLVGCYTDEKLFLATLFLT